jgi:ABC-type lipopolysaccharide export system ATPase subunit
MKIDTIIAMTKKSILIVDDVVEYVQSLGRALSLEYDIAKAFTLEEAKKNMNNSISLESSDGLSPKIVQDLLAKIREIRVKLVMTILLVEQNVGQALKVTDRAVVLINGEVNLSEGNPKELFTSVKLEKLFLGKAIEAEVNQ